MSQERFGVTEVLVGDCHTSINGGVSNSKTPPSSLSPSPFSSSPSIITTTASSNSENPNLSCPRCDSSNTKFCYYNNYNLTQPRHFCKTCRRYWTKGGALRNIPIGGGCRKNRTSTLQAAVGKSSLAKTMMFSSEIGRTWFRVNGFDQPLSLNPILSGSPQMSHLHEFWRDAQNPNQVATSVTNHSSPKNDLTMVSGLEVMTEAVDRSIGFDPLNQSSHMGFSNSVWRNNKLQSHLQRGSLKDDQAQRSVTQEIHQTLRWSAGNIFTHTSPSPSIVISTPIAGGELSHWNPAFSWSDLPTNNGAYL